MTVHCRCALCARVPNPLYLTSTAKLHHRKCRETVDKVLEEVAGMVAPLIIFDHLR